MNLSPDLKERLALLGLRAMGYSSPNPPVVAACLSPEGQLLGVSHTQLTGGNHAERELYQNLESRGIPIFENHILFVSLEPCNHWGKTPPCMELVKKFKPTSVYFGISDPNPLHKQDSSQYKELKEAIPFLFHNDLADLGRETLDGFLNRIEHKRPRVILKSAINKSGHFAPTPKSRLAVSGKKSKGFLSYLRAKVDAVLVGPGTVQWDSPSLTFRPLDWKDAISDSPEIPKWVARESKSLFTKSLLDSFHSFEEWEFHNQESIEYQPLRCFVLPKEKDIPSSFWKIQEEENQRNHRLQTMFYLLESPSSALLEKIDNLSQFEPLILNFPPSQPKELALEILQDLNEKQINQVLVEGGNLLYQGFSESSILGDKLFLVQNKELDFPGISPIISFSNQVLDSRWSWENDTWSLYTNEGDEFQNKEG